MDSQNPQRIIRAIEVCLITGRPYSSFLSNTSKKRSFSNLKFLLFLEKEILYNNINSRVDNMIKDGLIEEVETLKESNNLNALKTVGYKEIFDYLNGEIDKKSAIEIIEATKKLNEELKPLNLPPINVGIGVNTGDCIVGNMGSEVRFDYSVIGDAVNLAARLESQTRNYDGVDLLLSSYTYQSGLSTAVREIDRIQVKGKQEKVTIYTPIPGTDGRTG